MKLKNIILSALLVNSTGAAFAVKHHENNVYFRKIEADGSYSTVSVKYPVLTVKGTKKQIDNNIECGYNYHPAIQEFLCIRAGRKKALNMYDDFAKDVFAKTLPVFHYYTNIHTQTMQDLNFYTKKFNVSFYPKYERFFYLCNDVALIQASRNLSSWHLHRNIETIWGFYSAHPIDDKIGVYTEGNKGAFTCDKYNQETYEYLGHEKITMTKTHEGNDKFVLKFLELYQ